MARLQVPAILPTLLKPRHIYPLLALLCLALWLPGLLHLPPLDRDESRYAQAARHMLESGDYLAIRFDETLIQAPIGIYWVDALTTSLAGHAPDGARENGSAVWTYRLPSLAGGIASVWLTFWIGSLMSAQVGLLAALMMAFSVLLSAVAMTVSPDTLFLASVLGVQGVALRLYRQEKLSWYQALAGWAALAAGILMRGAEVAVVALATIVALMVWDGRAGRANWRWFSEARPLLGVPLALLLIAPWLIAILHAHRYGFTLSLRDYFLGLAGGGHNWPPGYYLLLSTVTFWPAILFLWPALAFALRRTSEPAIRFFLAWGASWWVIVELLPDKLPDMVLPAYPAFALLVAVWLVSARRKHGFLQALSMLQFLAGLIALTLVPILLLKLYGASHAMGPGFYAFLVGLIGLSALAMAFSATLVALALSFVAFSILIPTWTVATASRIEPFWLSQRIARLIEKDLRPGDPWPSLVGFAEPGLIFALDAHANVVSAQRAASSGAYLGGLVLVADQARGVFLARLSALHSDAQALAHVKGFDDGLGRQVGVTLYRVRQLTFEMPPPEE